MPLGYFQNGQFIHGNLYFRDNETGEFEKVCEITDVDEVPADNIVIEEPPIIISRNKTCHTTFRINPDIPTTYEEV